MGGSGVVLAVTLVQQVLLLGRWGSVGSPRRFNSVVLAKDGFALALSQQVKDGLVEYDGSTFIRNSIF